MKAPMMPVVPGPDVDDTSWAVIVVAVRIVPRTAPVVSKPDRKAKSDAH